MIIINTSGLVVALMLLFLLSLLLVNIPEPLLREETKRQFLTFSTSKVGPTSATKTGQYIFEVHLL